MTSDFFKVLAREADAKELEFLVIGGNAVNAYGYQRTTLDADLLIPEGRLESWRTFWESRGYRCVHATDAFCQFRSGDEVERFPVDLMIVTEATYEKIASRRQSKAIGGADLDVPDPLHLIALKLHALNSDGRAVHGKDLPDIIGLIRACDLDTESLEFQSILDRYANDTIRSEINSQLSGD